MAAWKRVKRPTIIGDHIPVKLFVMAEDHFIEQRRRRKKKLLLPVNFERKRES
jgi:hypothetical protein